MKKRVDEGKRAQETYKDERDKEKRTEEKRLRVKSKILETEEKAY